MLHPSCLAQRRPGMFPKRPRPRWLILVIAIQHAASKSQSLRNSYFRIFTGSRQRLRRKPFLTAKAVSEPCCGGLAICFLLLLLGSLLRLRLCIARLDQCRRTGPSAWTHNARLPDQIAQGRPSGQSSKHAQAPNLLCTLTSTGFWMLPAQSL